MALEFRKDKHEQEREGTSPSESGRVPSGTKEKQKPEDKQRTAHGDKGATRMTTTASTKVPDQFKKAAKHVRETIEGLLEPYDGKHLAAAQAAVSEIHRTGRPATSDEWRARYEAAIAKAVAKV